MQNIIKERACFSSLPYIPDVCSQFFFEALSLFLKPKCLDLLKSIISHKSKKLLNNAHLSLAYAAKFYFQTLSLFVKPKCWHFLKSILSHKWNTLFNNGHVFLAYIHVCSQFFFETLSFNLFQTDNY